MTTFSSSHYSDDVEKAQFLALALGDKSLYRKSDEANHPASL
jgi:hypothetical protein